MATSWQQVQRDFEARFPTTHSHLLAFSRFFMDEVDYGRFNPTFSRVFHVNDKARRAKGWVRRLSPTALRRHYLASSKTELLWYTSSLRLRKGKRYLLLMVDLDNKDGAASDTRMDQVAEYVGRELGCSYWVQPSTSGKGRHLYLTCWVGAEDGAERCKGWIAQVREALASRVRDRFGSAKLFDRINGSAPGYGACGSLAKLPTPATDDEARVMLKTLHWEQAASLAAIAAALSSEPKQQAGGSRRDGTHSVMVNKTAADPHSGVTSQEDTFERALRFAKKYKLQQHRQGNSNPSIEDCWTAYQAAGLDQGNSDRRCLADALNWVQAHFDPAKAPRPTINPDALVIDPEDLRYGRRGKLSRQTAADFLAHASGLVSANDGSLSVVELKRSCNLNNGSQVKALKVWAAKHGYLVCIDPTWINGNGKGQCQKWALGPQFNQITNPLYQEQQ